jgi:P-type Cu2+ transporter
MLEITSTPALIAPPVTTTIVLDVTGMKCAGCVGAVEKQLLNQAGVKSASVNLLTGVAAIVTEPATVTAENLADKLTASGFPSQARILSDLHSQADRLNQRQLKYAQESKQLLWQLITAGVLLGLSAVGHLTQPTTHLHHGYFSLNNFWWHWGLATLAIGLPGRSILLDGWKSLWHGNPNMNTLVGLGVITSYLASVVALLIPDLGWECFFEEPVMIIGFITLGRTLEQQAKHRAATAFDQLLSLQPTSARLVSPDPDRPQAIEIPVEQVKVGEYLRVLPGEKIPTDGKIRWGQTTIDESLITGESMPVYKQIGDIAIAGTVNQTGAILIEVTRIGDHTTLAQIIALVEAAQTRKAPVQKLADTVAGYFTYGVLVIAILTFLFWYLVGIHNPNLIPPASTLTPIKAAIAVMVVACPCALGLATPTAILVGTGIGAETGLLIKGGDVLETVHELETIVFDKTGTLTQGKPQVTDILTDDTIDSSKLLRFAAAAESVTNHPLATAIQQAAKQSSLPIVLNCETEAGLGVYAQVLVRSSASSALTHPELNQPELNQPELNQPELTHQPNLPDKKYQVIVGTQNWLNQHGIEISQHWLAKAEQLALAGKTVIYVAVVTAESQLLNPTQSADLAPVTNVQIGLIGVTDRLRDDAIDTVKELQQMGLKVVLLTGDRQPVATAIASQLGIEDIYAEVLPQDKARIIQSLQANSLFADQPHKVAMIGDGINDAPALAQADLGIALNAGTDIAIDVADIILMRDRLWDVVSAIDLSRSTLTKIRQNLFWAAIYNLIGIPAAAGLLYWYGWGTMLSPSAAGAMMALSSVSVVTNSLLLKLAKRSQI